MKRKRGCEIIRVVMHPRHANSNTVNGKMQVFGGEVMCQMDIAAGEAARSICAGRLVTVCFEKIVFKKPVFVGDLLECKAQVTDIGKSSITIKLNVHVIRNDERIHVTDGQAVFVCVDEAGKPTPVIGWDGKRPRKPRAKTGCASSAATAPEKAALLSPAPGTSSK